MIVTRTDLELGVDRSVRRIGVDLTAQVGSWQKTDRSGREMVEDSTAQVER